MQEFFRLQWCFVVDLNPKTVDGVFNSAPKSKEATLRIITNNQSEVTGTSGITNWLFAKGRRDLEVFDKKKIYRDTPRLFKDTFSKIVRTGKTDDYVIFDFCSGDSKYTLKLLDQLGDVFNGWDSIDKRCVIISFSNDRSYIDALKEWANDYDLSCLYFVRVGVFDFLHHIIEVLPQETSSRATHLWVHGKTIDLSGARERYAAAGIEFFGPNLAVGNEKAKWDFYSGAEITWEELDRQFDVQRELYPIIRQRVIDLIRTSKKVDIFTIRHKPGSGATTLARRLAYDIRMEDSAGNIQCTVIEVRNCSNIHLTEEYLSQLSEQVENTCVLAIIEAKRVSREKFDRIVKKMSDSGKRILFLYIETFTGKTIVQKSNVAYLDDSLKAEEVKRFTLKYLSLGLKESMLDMAKRNNHRLEVIDFPLMLRDNETSSNLSAYVMAWMETLPENLRKFCAYVGFVSKYSDSGVNQNLLKQLWWDNNHPLLSSYPLEIRNSLSKLLIEEYTQEGMSTGVWRPRYRRFSTFLLDAYKANWEMGLSDIAKSFITLCSETGQLGDDDKDMLYNIFIIRKNADYRALEDRNSDIRNKFSLLIKDLNDMERSESLFKALVDAFPDNAVFQGHFARFLYEKAASINEIEIDDRLFIDAQERLDIAFGLNSEDADLHHMQGMLIRRRILALQRTFVRETTKDPDSVNVAEYEETLEEWVENARIAFERSIALSPASPYGYAAECQLFREAIIFGSKLLQAKDYDFCETNPVYAEYTDKLGETLDLFEQICYTFKDEGLTQIMNSYPIYERVRLFHANIVGKDKEAISRYRNMYDTTKGEKKMLYGTLLVKSIVYSKIKRTKSKDSRLAYSCLGNEERKEIEGVLEYQKNQGDVKSFETMFLLKLYGSEEYSLDEAIDLLKEWETQYTDSNQYGWGYLSACYYLAVCYASKAIIGDVRNTELSSLAKDYFSKSEDIAKKFDKGTIRPLCYFGVKKDIHCIVDRGHKDEDAALISGVISRIHNNRGEIELKCGLTASFNPRGYDILKDEGSSLKGVLGFSYSGPGLYDFARGELSDEKDTIGAQENETTFEDLDKEFLPAEDLVPEPNQKQLLEEDNVVAGAYSEKSSLFHTESENRKIQINSIGKIDLKEKDSVQTKNAMIRSGKIEPKEGVKYHGVVEEFYYRSGRKGYKCTPDRSENLTWMYFILQNKPFDVVEGDPVWFTVKAEKNNNKEGLFWKVDRIFSDE